MVLMLTGIFRVGVYGMREYYGKICAGWLELDMLLLGETCVHIESDYSSSRSTGVILEL